MTTTVGLICGETVIIGSERRATMGSFIASQNAKKIFKIGKAMGMTIAGSVGDAQKLIKIVQAQINFSEINNKRLLTTKEVASFLSNLLNDSKYNPFMVQLIIAGVDKKVAYLYALDPLGGNTDETDFVATGSGSPGAYGVLEDNYKKGMSTEDGKKLIVRAIRAAMKHDSASGGLPVIATITAEEGHKEIDDEEVKAIAEAIEDEKNS